MRILVAGSLALSEANCSPANDALKKPGGVFGSCIENLSFLPASPVADYVDISDDRIRFEVRFYDTRVGAHRLKLSDEQEILDFIISDAYNIVKISPRWKEFPSAVIYRDFTDNSMRIMYYTVTDPLKQPACSQISYPSWDASSLTTAGNHLLKSIDSR